MKNTLIASVVTVALFASYAPLALAGNPSTTEVKYEYAQSSIEELTALIAKLTKQLEELKKASTVACFVSDKDLSLGDGEIGDNLSGDVERLQAFLREKGHFQFHKNTGFFGKLTRTALMSFQSTNEVAATGDFDSATRAKAHAMTCTKAVAKKVEEYKKEVKIEDKKTESSYKQVTSITATADYAKLRWTTNGYAKDGFKVVWSKNPNPTYPPRAGDNAAYYNGDSMKAPLDAFDGAGTYYARLCEYVSGACGIYSNEVQVVIE